MKIIIKLADKQDKKTALKIVKELSEWFTKKAVSNIKIDFTINNVIVAKNGKEIVGFLCYSSKEGIVILNWMGVRKKFQRAGIGDMLLCELIKIAKKSGSKIIQVETLTEEDDYEPYKLTRNFYKNNGFSKIYTKKAIKKGWDDLDVMELKLK
jgi:ribosomal protein S18 acetylase RimI-like enzyme